MSTQAEKKKDDGDKLESLLAAYSFGGPITDADIATLSQSVLGSEMKLAEFSELVLK